MLGIGIIDDREEQREEISEAFELALPKDVSPEKIKRSWELFSSDPLPNRRDYPFWIAENKIVALIIDERLREKCHVDYDGHDVVRYLRPRMRNLPIFVVTGYQDEVLKTIRDDVTEIIGKDEWGRRGNDLTKEILKKAEVYKKDNTRKLAKINELAQKVALGKATVENINELEELQMELALPFVEKKIETDRWLSRFEETVNKLEALEKDAKSFIEKIEKNSGETSEE